MNRKIPSRRELRKPKRKEVVGKLTHFTIDYLSSIGVPVRGLVDPVPVLLFDNDEFVIVYGKKGQSHSTRA